MPIHLLWHTGSLPVHIALSSQIRDESPNKRYPSLHEYVALEPCMRLRTLTMPSGGFARGGHSGVTVGRRDGCIQEEHNMQKLNSRYCSAKVQRLFFNQVSCMSSELRTAHTGRLVQCLSTYHLHKCGPCLPPGCSQYCKSMWQWSPQ